MRGTATLRQHVVLATWALRGPDYPRSNPPWSARTAGAPAES